MKILAHALVATGLLATVPAFAQTAPMTPQQIQQQSDQALQNQNNSMARTNAQLQQGQIQDQQQRDQLNAVTPQPAYQQPIYPRPPAAKPPTH